MLKNDKSYAFLLSHSSRSRIYIKRVEVPRNLVHFGSVGLFLFVCTIVLCVGAARVFETPVFAEAIAKTSVAPARAAVEQAVAAAETKDDTSQVAGQIASDIGGPADAASAISDDPEIAGEVLAIRTKADPAFLPTMWAHLGKINNEFGFRRNPFGGRAYEFHPGMDIDGERGEPVMAAANGTVINAGYKGGYGNMVEIDHGNGLTSRYGHLSKIEAAVGDTITRGKVLGQIGSTGRSTGPHLHFEVRLNDRPINPRFFLPTEPTDLNTIAR
jgi:murein DD-endopeptidase MepM/ murein hydrolase activator NlpD